ncbi:MAG: GGDEF domain-containing protein [Planctomycetes bacterium]|nr:GGDEF domain-containing protein [Planctomycetota bacterium]
MELSHLAFNIQALSIPPVALLLWQLARAVSGRYLVFWTVGWVALAGALLALRVAISVAAAEHPGAVRAAFSAYCCLEYVFGFLLWAGCRNLTTGAPLRRDAWVLVPPLVFGAVAPWAFTTTDRAYVYHAPIFGAFFLLALTATRGYRTDAAHRPLGIYVVRGCLLVLGLLFMHYGPVTYWAVWSNGGAPLEYMLLSPMYDALAEVGLAFGMAMVAIERVRDSLEAKNRELALASEQLAVAARTDALTGLLNRRALDALLKEWAGAPFAGTVAVIDLNSLKHLNDLHGHAAGDAAIQLVARALKGLFRITDPVFRTGGDEFLVVLVGGRAVEMSGRMEALDRALKAQRLPDVPAAVDLVVAWGLADFATGAGIPAAIEQADKAMYACKTGRKIAG